jgi:uncharacterized protein YceK
MMQRVLILLIVAALLTAGCSGVIMNAKYSSLLDQTAALSQDTADRATAGTLTPDDMKTSLVLQASIWQQFRNARNGVGGN